MPVKEAITLKKMRKSMPDEDDDAAIRARVETTFDITILPFRIILNSKPHRVTEEEVYRVAERELRKQGSEFFIFAFEVEKPDIALYEAYYSDELHYSARSVVKLWYFHRK